MSQLRPQKWLSIYSMKYPGVWNAIRDARTDEPHPWPAWCYVPLSIILHALGQTTLGQEMSAEERIIDACALTALAAWRMTKGVYRFDPTTFETLWNGGLEGDLPVSELYRLPEWCAYIEVEREIPTKFGSPMWLHGFFAHLDPESAIGGENGYDCLEILLDYSQDGREALSPVPLALRPASLQQIVFDSLDAMSAQMRQEVMDKHTREDMERAVRELGAAQVALVLYLCSAEADVQHERDRSKTPANPAPHPKKKRELAAQGPQVWEVGYRIGATLRGYLAPPKRDYEGAGRAGDSDERAPVTPHLRRAHWHTFWAGPRDSPERHTRVKWLPPIPVKAKPGETQTTLRSVK